MKRFVVALLVLAACGEDSTPPGSADAPAGADAAVDGAPIDTPSAAFVLTSPMLAEGARFDAANTCNGANTSPQLDWLGAPAGALSYAIVFTDRSNNLIHWVIYDIPADRAGLPANVDKAFEPANVPGAHQTLSFAGSVRGYLGPCPPNLHTYEFTLYALDVATLPATQNTTRAQAEQLILEHDLGAATLSGMYEQP